LNKIETSLLSQNKKIVYVAEEYTFGILCWDLCNIILHGKPLTNRSDIILTKTKLKIEYFLPLIYLV